MIKITDAQRAHYSALPAYVVMGTPPQANHPHGFIENSWTMDWSPDRVLIMWSGTAHSILGTHQLDGKKEAEYFVKQYSVRLPSWNIFYWDAHAEDCPIQIDWETWYIDNIRDNKFGSRNALFVMKDLF